MGSWAIGAWEEVKVPWGGGEFSAGKLPGTQKETSLSKVFSCCELLKL